MGNLTVTGTSIFSDGSVLNTLTLNVQATANTFLIGAGSGSTATEIGPLTDGQLIIGATAGAPAAGSLLSADGSIVITSGANSIDLSVAASNDSILTLTADAGGAVSPTLGNIDVQGVTVANAANAKPVFVQGTPGSSLIEIDVQVASDITGAPGDKLDAGLSSYNDTQFVVDADGYVSLVGGTDLPGIQTLTGDDSVATGPDASGNIDIQGLAVANATNAKPLYFNGGTNSEVAEIQVAAAVTGAPGDKLDAGICSFDDTAFVVDADGYVTLAGGAGPAVDTFTTDISGPVSPDGSGVVDITGTSVFSDGTVSNTITLNVQATANTFLLGAGAGSTATELGPLTDGQLIIGATAGAPAAGSLASSDGSVTITPGTNSIDLSVSSSDDAILTVTGDSGGALSPTSGNLNILGLSGSKTSGSSSTLTVKSPPYADSTAATLTVNSGTFATAAGAYTLPAAPADGDLCEIVCITTGIVVTANTGQEIQLAGDVTSTGGTATNSAKGDSLILRYRSTDTAWYSVGSPAGVWVLA